MGRSPFSFLWAAGRRPAGTQAIAVALWAGVVLSIGASCTGHSYNFADPSTRESYELALLRCFIEGRCFGHGGGGTSSGVASLPDTGLLLCEQANTLVDCVTGFGGTGGQDGHFVNIPSARSQQGPDGPAGFPGDHVVTDETTQLSWRSCSLGLTPPACGGGLSNAAQPAQVTACSALSSANSGAGYAGRTNWRLPNITELVTIMDMSTTGTTSRVDGGKFPAVSNASPYWSASTQGGFAWLVSFHPASATIINSQGTAGSTYSALCVSGTEFTTGPWTDLGDGTVRDEKTRLRWQQCTAGLSGVGCGTGGPSADTWVNALIYCNALAPAGTWRVPSMFELFSLVVPAATAPAINSSAFPGTPALATDKVWTSTANADTPANAYVVRMDNGTVESQAKGAAFRFRCVGGP